MKKQSGKSLTQYLISISLAFLAGVIVFYIYQNSTFKDSSGLTIEDEPHDSSIERLPQAVVAREAEKTETIPESMAEGSSASSSSRNAVGSTNGQFESFDQKQDEFVDEIPQRTPGRPIAFRIPSDEKGLLAIESRRAAFKLIDLNFKAVKRVLDEDGTEFSDIEELELRSQRILLLAEIASDIFQYDTRSVDAETQARDLIWARPLAFPQEMADFLESVDRFVAAVDTKAELEIRDAFGELELTCSSCHDIYRK